MSITSAGTALYANGEGYIQIQSLLSSSSSALSTNTEAYYRNEIPQSSSALSTNSEAYISTQPKTSSASLITNAEAYYYYNVALENTALAYINLRALISNTEESYYISPTQLKSTALAFKSLFIKSTALGFSNITPVLAPTTSLSTNSEAYILAKPTLPILANTDAYYRFRGLQSTALAFTTLGKGESLATNYQLVGYFKYVRPLVKNTEAYWQIGGLNNTGPLTTNADAFFYTKMIVSSSSLATNTETYFYAKQTSPLSSNTDAYISTFTISFTIPLSLNTDAIINIRESSRALAFTQVTEVPPKPIKSDPLVDVYTITDAINRMIILTTVISPLVLFLLND